MTTSPERLIAHDKSAPLGPGVILTHPLIIAMLVLWIINDHVLKSLLANGLTGKLSDIASLAVFPLIPVAVYEIACGLRGVPTRGIKTVLYLSLFATGSVMVGINVWDGWAEAYRVGLGICQWPFYAFAAVMTGDTVSPPHTVQLTMDPTDIWTLPSLMVPGWLQLSVIRRRREPIIPQASF